MCGGYLLARVFEEAGLPRGLLNVLPGGAEVGEALVTAPAPRLVTFTGSSAVGRRVGELAGRNLKKVSLELGGNSPMLVLDDADLDAASSAGAWGSFLHQGQVCMATSRHIVLRHVAAGATLVTGGTHDGLFYKPTVLGQVEADTRAFDEEIFGPVAPVTIAEDDDHAIELANSSGYGLAAAVQTGSVERGMRVARKLKAAMVHVND